MTTKEEQKRAMERALTPRTKDGRLVPVIFCDGPPEELYYPCLELDANGLVDPMTPLEAFADGKLPANMRYVPGYQLQHVPVDDPRYMDSIRYSNPELNLPLRERRVIWEWRNNGKVIPMKVEIRRGNQTEAADRKPPATDESGELVLNIEAEVITVGEETHVMTENGQMTLATFAVEAVEHRLVHKSSNVDDIEDEYELRVKCKGRTIRMVLAPKDINNAVDLIQRKLPMSTVSTAIKKPQALLTNFIRKQLSALPERHYMKVTGFIKMSEAWVFAHDGAEMPGDNVVFQTGKTIPVDPALTPRGAFRNAMDLLGISDKLELMLPMILVAHLSPLFRLFETAGYIPRFVTFISGRTGSLKTSTALVVFRLFAEQPASPEANFKDTETALEIKLGEANGKVALLDDYRPPVTSNDGKGNLVKLESVVRAAGDRVGKSRSNPELGKTKEFLPTGCVVITGEDLGGTQSSQLRMLILSIDKGDIDGKKLKVFQDNPLLFTSHMFHFLRWAGENGDAIIGFIRSNFETERSFFAQTLREGRVIDCAATLMLTARILHAYGEAVGALPVGGGVQLLHTWRQAVLQASIASESASKIQNPVCLYVQAVFDMLDRREIMVADELKSYEANKHIGYRAGGSIWLWHRELYNRVVQYWKKVGVLFPLTCEKINGHLDSAGLIKVSYETRGTGQKKLYVCKSSLPGRSRMLVLDEAKARAYLENESD
ncbi:MAG: hypothetical protein IJZ39_03085 [Oscillospiraceae bacterium]|nr:hypothetical protein [Oscillospiraceae bacterium]